MRKYIFLMLLFAAGACKKNVDMGVLPASTSVVLSTSGLDSSNNLVLVQLNAANPVAFNWTSGSNRGNNSSISYVLEIDKAGDNFASPLLLPQGKGVFTLGWTIGQLDDTLLNHWKATPGSATQLQARVVATVSGSSLTPDTSNVITLNLTPYQPVSTTLFVVGSSTPGGLDPTQAAPMTPNPQNPTTFTYQGPLAVGSLEFITTLGQSLPAYIMGASNKVLAYRSSAAQPDKPFPIDSSKVYLITLDLLTLNISIVPVAQPPYNQLWIIGAPFPNGWDINASDPTPPAQMFQNPNNPFIFTYAGILATGEFKIPTVVDGNFNVTYYRPIVSDPPITDNRAQLVPFGSGLADANDYKWEIYTPGPYQILLNTQVDTIAITPFTPYPQLWIMGQINSWSTSGATPMVDSTPYIFTYKGEFPLGEFKIPTSVNTASNYAIPYFRPYMQHPPLTDTLCQYVPVGGGIADEDDYKWNITTAGTYEVIINQLLGTIHIIYVGP